MGTTVQISEETRGKLLELISRLQIKRRKKLSYDDAIGFLLEQEQDVIGRRGRFVELYRGRLDADIAHFALKEGRNLERQ